MKNLFIKVKYYRLLIKIKCICICEFINILTLIKIFNISINLIFKQD